jgi:hypothetical protein
VKQYYPLFLAVPAVSYAIFALGLKLDNKTWTGAAWGLYALANVMFIVAYMKGE